MIRLSSFPFKTEKVAPKVSDNRSTSLLLQAGFIRQTMAGVYTYTTLWLKVLRKIENIVRKHMDDYGAYEILMPALSPKENWEKTWRWDGIDVMFHLPASWNKEYGLNSTHEEIVTPLMKEFIQSYKDLPVCVYQIQDKFRNEKRAKSGLLRWREFWMKDAYSFHLDNEEFENYYEWMKKVYMDIFNELGIWKDTYITLADGGTFTDKNSHEFQTKLEIWEDLVFKDPKTWICYNQEIAPSKVGKANVKDEILKDREDIKHSEDIIWVEALEKLLNIPKYKTSKTIFFIADEKRFIAASVRWDYEINEIKLRKVVNAKQLRMATEEEVKEKIGTKIGFAGIINLPEDVELYLDDSLENLTNFETWTNKDGYHSINVNFGKDLPLPEKFYDFKLAKEGDINPETGEKYEVFRASEVGNIFPLETKFTKPFNVTVLDENQKQKDVIMWCYGIWVSRLMWVIAEYFTKDEKINWPENIAPANYYIIVLWENNIEKAENIAKQLEEKWNEVILDDRMWKKFGFWTKIKDAELLGIPHIIVVSDKTQNMENGYEIIK